MILLNYDFSLQYGHTDNSYEDQANITLGIDRICVIIRYCMLST